MAKPHHLVFLDSMISTELHDLFEARTPGLKVTINAGVTATD
jgi:hypothetical protein